MQHFICCCFSLKKLWIYFKNFIKKRYSYNIFLKCIFFLYNFLGEPVNGIENRLDHCSISVSPSLNPDHESIDVPDNLLRQLAILGKVSLDGAEFSGAEMIYNYERVLRQVTYSNKKPAYYLNRQFRITCSELNGRFVSNEYVQTVSI